MKGSRFETIRWIFWPSIFVALTLAGCGTTTVAPTALPTPAITPAVAKKIETPLPAATPTTPVSPTSDVPATTPVLLKSPTAYPTFQYNIRILELTPAPTPTIVVDTNRTPDVCPTPILSSSIIHRNDDVGWRHYWASSSQQVSVKTLAIGGQWLWIATTKGVIRLNQHTLEYQLYPSTGTSPDIALDEVYTLKVDDQGRLWAGGVHGLVRYSEGTGWEAITVVTATSFALDKAGNLWGWSYYGRYGPSVYRFQGQEPPPTGDWKPERVNWDRAYLDPANWRWLALESGLVTEESTEDSNGNIWSFSANIQSLLMVYYNGELVHKVPTHNRGYSLVVTQAGMWIGTEKGLFYSDGQTLKSYQLTDGKALTNYPLVESLYFDADGTGWANTSQGRFHFSAEAEAYKLMTETLKPITETRSTKCLVYDSRNRPQWPDSAEYHDFKVEGDKSVVMDATGKVWLAYKYGVWRYGPDEGWCRILTYQVDRWVSSARTDAHNDFWFIDSGNFIIRCSPGKCELWDLRDDYWGGPITAMAADTQGRIWIGGYGLLSVYDPAAERQ